MPPVCGHAAIVAGLVLATFIMPPCAAQTKRAVLIGIDCYNPNAPECGNLENAAKTTRYPRPPSSGNWRIWRYDNLKGAKADVDLMEGILKPLGFETLKLEDEQATADTILTTLRDQLVTAANPGDLRVVYYSGHGNYVRNTASHEVDSYDQTIVPADHFRGVADVRDKELSRILFDAGTKGVRVVFIADSCHSGSLTRAFWRNRRIRTAREGMATAADSPVVNDPPDIDKKTGMPIDPATVGVITLSAAQRNQPAEEIDLTTDSTGAYPFGNAHGAFTWALKRAIDTGANQTIDALFQRTVALLKADNLSQVPVLEGRNRSGKGIFGQPVDGQGNQTAAVEMWDGNDLLQLRGGRAIGIYKGTQLRRLAKDAPPIEIEVTKEMGMVLSEARIVDHGPPPAKILPGELFEVDKWVVPLESMLKVYIPPAARSTNVYGTANEIGKLKLDNQIHWVNDAVAGRPTHVMSWNGNTWILEKYPDVNPVSPKNGYTQAGRIEPPIDLGISPTASDVRKHLPDGASFLFLVPPTSELSVSLTRGLNGNIDIVPSSADAQYWLEGRAINGTVEFAWVIPDSTEDPERSEHDLPLPLRSDWTPLQAAPQSLDHTAGELIDKAQRIGRLRSWLILPNPPGGLRGNFPYQLVFRQVGTDRYVTSGDVRGGSKYKICLQASPSNLRRPVVARWIYIFAIDHYGKGSLLFPALGRGNEGNQFPPKSDAAAQNLPPLIEITGPGVEYDFEIAEPYGIDTYLMLTTQEPVDNPDIFEFDGPRSGAAARGIASVNPLTELLSAVGAVSRAASRPVPSDWSIQRLTLRSVAPR